MPLPKFDIKPKLWEREEGKTNSPIQIIRIEPEKWSESCTTQSENSPVLKHKSEVQELLKFFETYQPKAGSIMLNNHTRIDDQRYFVKDALRRITHNEPDSRVYKSELYRLNGYFELIKN